jgi:predicted HicB family RNase H-like nuclease
MDSEMKYRGYSGSILLSAGDGIFHGRILAIRDAITYKGFDLCDLERNFKSAIDEYLRFCAEEGKTADSSMR